MLESQKFLQKRLISLLCITKCNKLKELGRVDDTITIHASHSKVVKIASDS